MPKNIPHILTVISLHLQPKTIYQIDFRSPNSQLQQQQQQLQQHQQQQQQQQLQPEANLLLQTVPQASFAQTQVRMISYKLPLPEAQGCQIFLDPNIPNWEKYNK
jgi:hypothetical protein